MTRQTIEIPSGFGRIGSLALDTPISVLDPQKPLTVDVSHSIKGLIETLQENHIGCALVVDDKGCLAGIVSERDILIEWVLSDLPADTTPVSLIMTAEPMTLTSSSTVAGALYLMSKGGFRHMPIVDEENKPIGIVSVKDIMDFIALQFMKNLFAK